TSSSAVIGVSAMIITSVFSSWVSSHWSVYQSYKQRRSGFTPPATSRPPTRRAKRDQSSIHLASLRSRPEPPFRYRHAARKSARKYQSDPRRQWREPRFENPFPTLWRPVRPFACASSAPPIRRL